MTTCFLLSGVEILSSTTEVRQVRLLGFVWVASLLHPPRNENGAGRGRGPGPRDVHTLWEEGQALSLFLRNCQKRMSMPTQHMTMPSHPEDLLGYARCLWPRRMASAIKHQTRSTATFSRHLGEVFTEQMFMLRRSMPWKIAPVRKATSCLHRLDF